MNPDLPLSSLPKPLPSRPLWLFGVCLAVASQWPVWAQGQQPNRAGIYTCIDAQGRRLTSDRPIPECLDREQRELGPTGTVRRVVPPSYTAEERARIEAQRRADEEARSRVSEDRRRERALLIRYPNQEAHDRERALLLAQVDEVIDAVQKRETALVEQRREIDLELEFYQNDPARAPAWLRRKLEDNEQQMEVQKRFIAEQDQEKRRINERFDEELANLRRLWSQVTGSSR